MVGAFVLAMGVAFLVTLYLVTGRQGPTDDYYVQFENVSGLKFGTGVFYEGYRVGQIEEITPQLGSTPVQYRLRLSVTRGWPIPSDSVAQVVAAGLIAAMKVEIKGGASATALTPGATIESRAGGNLFAVMGQAAADFRELSQEGLMPLLATLDRRFNEVADEVISLKRDDISPLIQHLDQNLNDDVFAQLNQILSNLDHSVASFDSLMDEDNKQRIEMLLVDAQQTAAGINEWVNGMDTVQGKLMQILTHTNDLVGENKDRIYTTLMHLDEASKSMNHTAQVISEEIDAIVHHLSMTSRNANEFTRAIREDPSRVIRSAPAPEAD